MAIFHGRNVACEACAIALTASALLILLALLIRLYETVLIRTEKG